jgi:hypothetical protein
MTYGVIVRVPAPIRAYEASHAEVMKATGGQSGDGLIFHVARATEQGFEMIEVWESKAHSDKFNEEVVGPAVTRTGVDQSGANLKSLSLSRSASCSPALERAPRHAFNWLTHDPVYEEA